MVKLKKAGESSVNVENPASTIGERLRSARQKKGLSLEDVHRITKIHPKTIEALEKDQLEDKVGGTYVKAFIRNYATYLGMDAKSIIEEYVSKKSGAEVKKDDAPKKRAGAEKEIAPPRGTYSELIRAVMTVLVFIVVLFVIIFGAAKMGQYAKGAVAKIKFKSAPYKKVEPPKEIAKEIVPIPKQDKLTLTVTASAEVWLKVILDGKVAFHQALSKKSQETWKADKEIRLAEIGKPESLKLVVNGKDIDFSKNRLSRSILITQEGVDFKPK